MVEPETPSGVEMPPDLIEALSRTNEEIKRLTDTASTLKDLIKKSLGDSEFATVDGQPRIRWAHVKTRRLDMEELRTRIDPAVLAECYVEDIGRRFILLSVKK